MRCTMYTVMVWWLESECSAAIVLARAKEEKDIETLE